MVSGKSRRNVNITPGSWKADLVKYLGGGLLAVVLLFAACVLLVDLIVPHVSIETERKLFNVLDFAGFTVPGERQPAMEAAVREMLDRVPAGCRQLGYAVRVEVIKGETVNAFALPGGRIVVMTGLLDKLDSENELMFVLGHEMGHMVHRDHLSGFLHAVLLSGMKAALKWATGIEFAADPLDLTELAFSRDKESDADRFGVDFVNCAYGHVAGVRQFFRTIGEADNRPGWMAYLSTHPGWKDRLKLFNAYEIEKDYVENNTRPLPAVFR